MSESLIEFVLWIFNNIVATSKRMNIRHMFILFNPSASVVSKAKSGDFIRPVKCLVRKNVLLCRRG